MATIKFPDDATKVATPTGDEKIFAARNSDGKIIYFTASAFVSALVKLKKVGGESLFGTGNVDIPLQDLTPLQQAITLLGQSIDGKVSVEQVNTVIDASTLHVDMTTAKGAVYPNPTGNQPAIGTPENPAVLGGSVVVTDHVQNGNENPVTSAGVYNAISAVNSDLQQKYNELYALLSSGKTTPAPPNAGAVDDVANTFTFVNTGGLTDADTETTNDGGATVTANNANPFSFPDANYAPGMVGIRYKGTNNRNPSQWTFNQVALTGSVAINGMLPGFVRPDFFGGIKSPNIPEDLGNGSIGAPNGSGNGNLLTKHYFQNGSRIAAKIGTAETSSGAIGAAQQYDVRGIRAVGFWDGSIHPFNGQYGQYEDFVEGTEQPEKYGVAEYVAATNSFDFYIGTLNQDGTASYQKLTPTNGFVLNDLAGEGGKAYFQIDIYDGLKLENIQMFNMLTDPNV